jgi:hypothetical protein
MVRCFAPTAEWSDVSAADGVIPGSLVFADNDPSAAIRWIKSLGQKAEQALA